METSEKIESASPDGTADRKTQSVVPSWLAYVLPMVLFLILTASEGAIGRDRYPFVYMVKATTVTAALILCSGVWRHELKFEKRHLPSAIVAGIFVFIEWIAIDKLVPYPHIGERISYNPFAEIGSDPLRWTFLAFRIFGLSLMVPLMEEVFWRSFLLRFADETLADEPDPWQVKAVGIFSNTAMLIVSALFALAHSEWLAAFICGISYALLLRLTKNLTSCFIAHAITNALLGIYVLVMNDWKFW